MFQLLSLLQSFPALPTVELLINMLSSWQPAGETRFATVFIMLDRVREQQQALEETMVDSDWKEWVDASAADVQRKAERVHDIISRRAWWRQLLELLGLLW